MPFLKYQHLFSATLLLILVILQSANSLVEYDAEQKCEELLVEYANSTSCFTKCFIMHARPITVCQDCVNTYKKVVNTHEEIFKDCKSKLINVDRLEVIESNFQYVTSQWKLAACDDCFQVNSTDLNDATKQILELYLRTILCEGLFTNGTNYDAVCTNCSGNYFSLNNFYDSQGSYEGFCMDIVDMMNATRYNWSVVFRCCTDRRKSASLFFGFTGFICCLPLMFYFLVWLCSKDSFLEINFHNRWARRFPGLSSISP